MNLNLHIINLFLFYQQPSISKKQGRKCPLDTPKKMIERREKGRKRYREGGRDKRER